MSIEAIAAIVVCAFILLVLISGEVSARRHPGRLARAIERDRMHAND